MGRKRKNKKRRKKPSASRPVDTVETVRKALGQGSTKTTLARAKALEKANPSPETEALLLEAYMARIDDLLATGLVKEGAEILERVATRFPEAGNEMALKASALAVRAGDVDPLLRKLTAPDVPAGRRKVLETLLAENLMDPRALAESPVLAPDHPLRRAAVAVTGAFDEAAEGNLTDAGRAGLSAVARRSPLLSWRHLALAIDAYHRGNDEAMRAALRRIPEGVPVGKLGQMLEALAEGGIPDEAGRLKSVSALVHTLTGGAEMLCTRIERARLALEDDDERAFTHAMEEILTDVARLNPVLAARVVRWLEADEDDLPMDSLALSETADRILPDGEYQRIEAIEYESVYPDQALEEWISWLGPRLDGKRPLSDLETALVLDRISLVLTSVRNEMGISPTDPDTSAEVRFLLAFMKPFVNKLRKVHKTVIRIETFLDDIADLCLRLDPTRERFQRRYEQLRKKPPREIEDFLELWAGRFPDSVEPVLHLAREARGRKALKKAEGYIDRALGIDPLDRQVRQVAFHVQTDNLLRHMQKRNRKLIRKDLDRLEGLPAASTPERRGFLAAARHGLAELENDAAGMGEWRRRLEELVGNPGADVTLMTIGARIREKRSTPIQITCKDRRDMLLQVAFSARMSVALDWDYLDLVNMNKTVRGVTLEDLPDDLRDLEVLCALADHQEEGIFLHMASGKGMLADGPLLPRFLMYRWSALDLELCGINIITECRRLALHHASRTNDTGIIREIHQRRQERDSFFWPGFKHFSAEKEETPLDPETARFLLERERFLQGRIKDRSRLLRAFKSRRKKAPVKNQRKKHRKKRRKKTASEKAPPPVKAPAPARQGQLPFYEDTENSAP